MRECRLVGAEPVPNWSLTITRDQDTDDQPVNGNDTSHNDGNNALDQQIRAQDTHGADTDTGLGRSVGSSQACLKRRRREVVSLHQDRT